MKIDKINIIKMCNMSHPDFGIFAKFLDGLGKDGTIDVPQPTQMFLCDVCTRPLWMEKAPCLYCLGLKDGKDSVKDLFKEHTHTWTVEDDPVCIKCGIRKLYIDKVMTSDEGIRGIEGR